MRQTRLGNAKDSKKRKQSLETDCQRQTQLEKDRLYQKNKRAKRVPPPQNEKVKMIIYMHLIFLRMVVLKSKVGQ